MFIAKLLDICKITEKPKWGETKHIKTYGLVYKLSNKMQHKAVCLSFCKFTVHVSGDNHTHHQEYTQL